LLDQLVLEPTHITETQANILDLFFTNNETLVNQVRIIPGISDHESVFIESSLRPMKKQIPPHKVWQYRKAKYDQLREELHQYQQEFNKLDASTSTDDMWLAFKTKLTTLMKMYIPQKTVKGNKNNKQWINREVKSALRRKNKLFKKKKASQKPSDIKKYKDAKATVQRIQRKAYWEYVDNIIEFGDPEKDENPGKQKRFWSYIKLLRKDTSGVSPLKENGKMHGGSKG
jgi:hypothetical protein